MQVTARPCARLVSMGQGCSRRDVAGDKPEYRNISPRGKSVREIARGSSYDIALEQLVDWAEIAMLEGEFDERESDSLRTVIARLGVADVRAFGLTWEDCEQMLRELGYLARVDIVRA